MLESKEFMEQFLQYLQTYYGMGREQSGRYVARQTNTALIPLFQDSSQAEEPAYDDQMMAEQLNGMFPGPYDPMRLN